MRKTFLMLLVAALAGFGSFAGDAAGKELKDVKLNYNKLACERLDYGIYKVSSDSIAKILANAILNKAASSSLAVETKVNWFNVTVNYEIGVFGFLIDGSVVCKKNVFLTPESMTAVNLNSDDREVNKIKFKSGMMLTEQNGKTVKEEFPTRTVSMISLFRVMPQMPKEKGVRYEFDSYFPISGFIRKPADGKRFAIVYAGQEDIKIGNETLNCQCYDLLVGELSSKYYVDEKDRVVCVKSESALIKLLDENDLAKLREKRKKQAKASAERRARMLEDIHDVMSVGGVDDIKKLLEKDALLVNKKNNQGETPLHLAAYAGKLDAVKFLVERNADVTALDNNGRSCLYRVKGFDTAKYLLKQSPKLAEINYADGWSPLTYGVSSYNKGLVKALIKYGADVNAQDKNGRTGFTSWAGKDPEIGKMLIAAGADVNTNFGQYSVLHKAASGKNVESVKLLVSKGADIDAVNRSGACVLHYVTDAKIAEYLLRKSPELCSKKDSSGRTPLFTIAKRCKDGEIVKVLVSKGADVNAVDKSGNPVLHYAAEYGKLAGVKSLVENGANIMALNKYEQRVAHRVKKADIMKYLISQKPILVRLKDKSGRTPLLQMFSEECAEVLIANGADVNAVSKNGTTALHTAAMRGHNSICTLLIGKGLDVNAAQNNGTTPLHEAVGSWNKETVKLLLDNGANLDAVTTWGASALHIAAARADAPMCTFLINLGHEVSVVNKQGQTPLHKAAGRLKPDTAKVLLDNGAKIDARDIQGFTPLHLSAMSNNVKIAEFLIAKGAKLNVKDNKGRTPLHMAVLYKRNDAAALLKKHGTVGSNNGK